MYNKYLYEASFITACISAKASAMKPTSVLTIMIQRIYYLVLARSRIDLSFRIPPPIFTNRYNKIRQMS